MSSEIISRFDANLIDIVRDRRKRKWIVVNIEHRNGGHTQLHYLVRLGAKGPWTRVKILADEEYENFQYDGEE